MTRVLFSVIGSGSNSNSCDHCPLGYTIAYDISRSGGSLISLLVIILPSLLSLIVIMAVGRNICVLYIAPL